MSRRGRNKKSRDRRHRAAVALRSQSSTTKGPAKADDETARAGTSKPPLERLAPPAVSSSSSTTPIGRAVDRGPLPHCRAHKPSGSDLQTLSELVVARETATKAISDEVRRLRKLGVNWADIGTTLGVSRQAARQKFKPGV